MRGCLHSSFQETHPCVVERGIFLNKITTSSIMHCLEVLTLKFFDKLIQYSLVLRFWNQLVLVSTKLFQNVQKTVYCKFLNSHEVILR